MMSRLRQYRHRARIATAVGALVVVVLLLQHASIFEGKRSQKRRKVVILTYFDNIRIQECLFLNVLGRKTDALVPLPSPPLSPSASTDVNFLKKMKPNQTLRYLMDVKNFNDDDIVLFLDTDVYVSPTFDLQVVAQRYLKEFGPSKFVLMGERNCWPWYLDIEENRSQLSDAASVCGLYTTVQNATSSFRYVNSGAWISTVGVAKAILMPVVDAIMAPDAPGYDDQYFFSRLYLLENYGRMVIDDHCIIFQSAHKTSIAHPEHIHIGGSDGALIAQLQGQKDAVILSDGRIYNSETGTFPLLAHFNGDKSMFAGLMTKFLQGEFRKPMRSIFTRDTTERLQKYGYKCTK